ncbi:MAG: alpha/beta fold hydrolase, partial [Leptolyngbya sp. SIO1D8]|nr:alpha/beta fold hydrolase [Leptolyngbya sp. SIO1D8]
QGGQYRLFGLRFQSANVDSRPVLCVVLHGDAPGNRPEYQYIMASQIAQANDNVVTVALLRPRYEDPTGNISDGERGDSVGDNWNAKNTDSIAEAIETLGEKTNARKVVLIGHSGGAAIAANIIARHYSLIHGVILVSFPGDVNHWRRYMFTKTGADAFKGDIDSLSVLQDIDQISDALKIRLIVGEADDVTPPELGLQYAALLEDAGKTVDVVRVGSKGHEIFLEPDVLQIVSKVVSEVMDDSD